MENRGTEEQRLEFEKVGTIPRWRMARRVPGGEEDSKKGGTTEMKGGNQEGGEGSEGGELKGGNQIGKRKERLNPQRSQFRMWPANGEQRDTKRWCRMTR